GVYGREAGAGRLVVLARDGALLFDVTLAGQQPNANGVGVGAAPSIADLDGDGTLEIVVATFDHGLDVLSVPGSGAACLPWPTARGSLTRAGAGPATAR